MKHIKNQSKALSIFLITIFLLSTLSLNTAAAATFLKNADITISAPIAGECPSYSATISSDKFEVIDEEYGYIYHGVTWYDWTLDSNIDYDDEFIDGHVYSVTILIRNTAGNNITLLNATVNGNSAELSETTDDYGNPYYLVQYYFGEKPTNIDETANITITEPVAGELPSYEATIGNECFEVIDEEYGYIYHGVTWYDWTLDSNIDYDDEFIDGHVYSVTILVKKAEGCELDLLYATVNGNSAEISETTDDYGNPYYLVQYYFGEKPTNIDETADITITRPIAGRSPSYEATIGNECFEILNLNVGYVFNGVTWYDDTFDSNVDSNDTFYEAHYYTVSFYVAKAEGCELELLYATVNGNGAEISEVEDYYIISYQFYIQTEAEIVTFVEIFDISKPTAGNSFDYTVTLSGDGYNTKNINNSTTINGISWYDCTDEKYVETTDVCLDGHSYSAIIQLEAVEGYILLPEVVKINGDEVGFSYEGTDVVTEKYYEYIDPIIKEITFSDVRIPVQGDYPDYEVSKDNYNCHFQNKNDAYFTYGVAWFDVTDGSYLEPGINTFIGAHEYMIELYLEAEEGFSFALRDAKLEGSTAVNIWNSGSKAIIYFNYPPAEAPTDISITINTNGGNAYYVPKIELINLETEQVIYDAVAYNVFPGNNTYFICRLDFVYPTNYIMKVTMEGCATRYYPINVSSSNWAFNADLFATGDVNMDGSTNVLDYQSTVNLALDDCEVPHYDTASDYDYTKALADITGDGIIDVIDCFYAEKKA